MENYSVNHLTKIQSPLEQESLVSLAVLEACVKSCGTDFHSELGKFRFLQPADLRADNRQSPKKNHFVHQGIDPR